MSLNTRIQLTCDTAANWATVEDTFVPLAGETIVYLEDTTHPARIKIGNGIKTLGQLSFISAGQLGHTLTFGDGTYVYDGSADVTVPVYTGEYI